MREFNGEKYVKETGLFAEIAIVHAFKGDTESNLIYCKTARNFNSVIATASRMTIAEVEHMVDPVPGSVNSTVDHIRKFLFSACRSLLLDPREFANDDHECTVSGWEEIFADPLSRAAPVSRIALRKTIESAPRPGGPGRAD